MIEVERVEPSGLFTNYIFKAIPLAFDESMSYYECLCGLLNYMKNTMIPALNNNADAVIELQGDFTDFTATINETVTELEDFVNNYFDNLDVQEEINNKLDAMVEDGTLPEIIATYLNAKAIFCFDTVADMLESTNLIDGSFARTLGYYAIQDGGGALYKIVEDTPVDEFYEELTSGLYAVLIVEDVANVLQFGAYGDNTHDDTAAIQACANIATAKKAKFLMPDRNYKCDTVTLNNILTIEIRGAIYLNDNTQNLNVYEDVEGERASIFIRRVVTGNLLMKGLNSCDITIEQAEKLILLADNTDGHRFIGYNKFNLGNVKYLEIGDDGSGTKWVNENLFIGGRFLGVTIGASPSTYNHQNNLFLKPMCENCSININKGIGNRFIDARLEGANTAITFGADTYANVVTSNYASFDNTYYIPYYRESIVTDNSGGKNKFIGCEDLISNRVLSINKFNNPKSITVTGDDLVCGGSTLLFESEFVSLPPIDTLLYFTTTNTNFTIRIECYDDTFTKLTGNPNLLINSSVLGYTSAGTYGNSSYTRNDYWCLMDGTNQQVKYLKIKLYCPSGLGLTDQHYKNIDMFLNYYGKLDNEGYYIKGFGTQASS